MSGAPPADAPASPPDLPLVAALLQRHGVECVLVGGMSAILHGSSVATKDIDTVASWSRQNLERLCRALNDGGAEIMVQASEDGDPAKEVYERFPGGIDVDDIRHLGSFRVRIRSGDRIDVLSSIPVEPGAGGLRIGYAELAPLAEPTIVSDGVIILVVDREVLLRSKRALGRPHDLEVVAELTADPDEGDWSPRRESNP